MAKGAYSDAHADQNRLTGVDHVYSHIRTYDHDTATGHSTKKGGESERTQEKLRRGGRYARQD